MASACDLGWRGQQITGVAVAGVGLAGLIAGAALGLSAIRRNNSATAHCRGGLCDRQALTAAR